MQRWPLMIFVNGMQQYNMLKLNDDKTEMLVISSKYYTIPKTSWLECGSTVITPGEHVRNFGVIMDTKFTTEPHINKTMQIAFLKIHPIFHYRNFLTPAPKTLIHACITSGLDYCSGILLGLPSNLVIKLQSILNTAARLVTKTWKYESITPATIYLHCKVTSPVQDSILIIAAHLQVSTWLGFKLLNG